MERQINGWVLIGAIFLVTIGIVGRVMVGSVLGLLSMAFITNILAPYSTNAMLTIPPHYHLVMGRLLVWNCFYGN